MAYIKGFKKPEIKDKPVGAIQIKRVLKEMKYAERKKLMPEADLGTRRRHLHDLADDIKKEYGKIPGERFQRAAVKLYGPKEGLTDEQKELNIRLWRQQRLSEEEGTYKSFADKLKERREKSKQANIEGRKEEVITKSLEAAVSSSKSPVAGSFASGKPEEVKGFAGNKLEKPAPRQLSR